MSAQRTWAGFWGLTGAFSSTQGIKASKRTIQKYMRGVRTNHGGQSWATFLSDRYFEESIGISSLLFLTGNFPNPMSMPKR